MGSVGALIISSPIPVDTNVLFIIFFPSLLLLLYLCSSALESMITYFY